MDAYRQLQGATGRLAAFANKKYTSHGCLPASWLTECMKGYEATFGEKAEASMLDIASVTADVVGRSRLRRELDAEEHWSCPQPNCSSGGASSCCFLMERRYERTGPTTAIKDASQLRGGRPIATLDSVGRSMYYKIVSENNIFEIIFLMTSKNIQKILITPSKSHDCNLAKN